MDIGQLSRITGVSARAIAHYHHLGLLGHHGESDTVELDFDHQDIHSVKLLKLASQCGYKLRDILSFVEAKNRGDLDVLMLALHTLETRRNSTPASDTDTLASLDKLSTALRELILTP